MCGEKRYAEQRLGINRGSPPRVRGKVSFARRCHSQGGITPARAGKSCGVVAPPRTPRDHPRVCGEKLRQFSYALDDSGSPPRVRGKAAGSSRRRGRPGITPACAGKSCVSSAMRWMIRDHPRVCGEKSAMLSCRFAPQGSPPRVRGKGHCFLHLDFQKGITPARAGKSLHISCTSVTL